MKIDRLIGILAVLLQKEKVTAPYLAEKFEVSRRTINRDIEAICNAGIPIVTTQGQNGGISIIEGYKCDRTLLTSNDMQAILAGLRSLDTISGTSRYQQLMEKLSVGDSDILSSNNHIMIDLSTWRKSSLAPKIELIQTAISECNQISFLYFSPKGEGERVIEPYRLLFKWSSWYVWGYCLEKSDFRLFKLNRMMELQDMSVQYKPRETSFPELSPSQVFPLTIEVLAVFDSKMKWRLIEEYGVESFREREDGKLLFSQGFTDKNTLFYWLLGFGDMVELLEPIELRKELLSLIQNIGQKYR